MNPQDSDHLGKPKYSYEVDLYDFDSLEVEKSAIASYDRPRIENKETLVERYYQQKGYSVLNLVAGSRMWDIEISVDFAQALKSAGVPVNIYGEHPEVRPEKGTPDIAVFDGEECFLVEVKSGQDTLSIEQFQWVFDRNCLVKMAYVDEQKSGQLTQNELIDWLTRFDGIGRKSAKKLVQHGIASESEIKEANNLENIVGKQIAHKIQDQLL